MNLHANFSQLHISAKDILEKVVLKCSVLVLKNVKNASEGKWRPAALLYMKNLSQAEMFSPEFCEVFKNIFLQYPCILTPLKFEANLKFCKIQKFEILKI